MAEIAEEITAKYGQEACDSAIAAAGLAGSEGSAMAVMEFALLTAALVPEFRGEEEPAVYSCPECLDRGYIVVTGTELRSGRTAERISGCQRCDKGLSFEAGGWMEQIHPRNERGERMVNSPEGWRRFHTYFERNLPRKHLVMDRMGKFQEAWK